MKCKRCQAVNPRGARSCWACGVRLTRSDPSRKAAFRPEAMRYYRTSALTVGGHHAWLDGIVLLSTILFGLLLGYFIVDIVPRSGAGTAVQAATTSPRRGGFSLTNPISFLLPSPEVRAAVRVGSAQEVNGIVSQVADARRSKTEDGRNAPAGSEFLTTTVVVDNQSKQSFTYNLSDFQVRDSKGRMHSAEGVRGGGWLSGGTIDPGQHVQGAVTFLVPEGDTSPQVNFTSKPLRVVLRWDV